MIPKLKRQKLHRQDWKCLRQEVFDRDKWRCRLCGTTQQLTPDHIIKRSQGGDDNLANLWTLCADCHRRKDERRLTPQEIALIPTGSQYGHPSRFRTRQ